MSFENKVVIITGCSSGIGLATTRLLLARKAKVFGIDIAPFTQELSSSTFAFHQVDLTEPNAANEAVAACIQTYGPKIDILANVAGVMDAFASADTVKDSEWERVLSINLTVPVRLMAAVLPSMKEHKGGAIVNVASRAAQSGAVAGVAYTASKHGLVGATKNVAWRFHNDGIRCNAVLPGGVATNIHSSIQRENWDMEAYTAAAGVIGLHSPSNAQGVPQLEVSPEDVANAIVFLASDEARKVNGVLMPVDNAWSAI
ncbi:short-chain dehydrogenase/reductase SDR [Stagonosporopsis vannaccii]|nr:short-chain dehydrogenase/reductase SDR [Stagonosporopsis vannaccii]